MKIQSKFKSVRFAKVFGLYLKRKKKELEGSLVPNRCEVNDINVYLDPKVRRIEEWISNKSGIFSTSPLKTVQLFENLDYSSKYNLQMPCVYLNDEASPSPVYKGYWSITKKKNGYGVLVKSDGSKYEGFFNNGILDGRGRYITPKGDVFDGNFVKGKACGYGILVNVYTGVIYLGDWKDDLVHGTGMEYEFVKNHDTVGDGVLNTSDSFSTNTTFTSDSKYTVYRGDFKFGKKNGNGTFEFSDGSYYEGGVVDDLQSGHGLYKWVDGKSYTGQWKSGNMHGNGKFVNPDGQYYDGSFLDNKKYGFGKYVWNKNKYYQGNWVDGKQHGEGTMVKNGTLTNAIYSEGKISKKLHEEKLDQP